MTKLVSTLFGDNGKAASKQQTKQNEQERAFILGQTQKAQDLLQGMYPTMQQNAMLGGQAAYTTLRNALPQQAQLRQQGTQNAIAAILGGQGQQLQPNFDFMPQNLPQFQTYQQPQAPYQMNPQATEGMNEAQSRDYYGKIAQMLGGR